MSAARRLVAEALQGRAPDDVVDSVVLAVSELVTNAVVHARTVIDVRMEVVGEQVRVDVEDGDDALPVLRDYGTLATTGRGLALVAELAHAVGVDRTAHGKRVWFTVPLAGLDVSHGPRPADGPSAERQPDAVPRARAAGGLPSDPGPSLAVLEGLPVALWLAARQHHEAALREYTLYQAPRLTGTAEAWSWFDAAMSAHAALDTAIDEAVAARQSSRRHSTADDEGGLPGSVPSVVTAVLLVEPDLPGRLLQLLDALDQIELLATDGRLLLPPAPPELVAVRDWCCEQVIAQAGGSAPAPWQPAPRTRTR